MPLAFTAATGMDALTHAVEAYVSRNAGFVMDTQAWKAIQLVAKNLPLAVRDGTDMNARENMCCASFLAGAAFNNAGLGLVHTMSHPLGGHCNLPKQQLPLKLLMLLKKPSLVAMSRMARE